MTITFSETTAPPGLEVHDSIEQRRLQVETSGPVSPEEIEPAGFCFPVDTTCVIETDELVFDQPYSVTIHDRTGQSDASFDTGETIRLDDELQFIGLSGPIKLYCRIDVAGTIDVGVTSVRITLDREVSIELGMRSLHERPAATITTPPDVESMMAAVSALPSALKTTTAERTWPTLRGHPPLIELGDDLEIPDAVSAPDGDVTLTVPPDRLSLYRAAPLAFFLGATVRPGSRPALEAGRFERALPTDGPEFENTIARLLKRFFFLECLTRTEGIFRYELHERRELEPELPYDLADIYEADLPARLERYLDVPAERLEPYIPRWPLTAHVPDDPDTVELLPFLVNELGIVRDSRGEQPETIPGSGELSGLVRSATRASGPSESSGLDRSSFVVPAVTDESVEHAWFGDGIPQRASKATLEAYRNQMARDARNESIEILLVCNDARMIDEHDLLDGAYGNRELLPFEIRSAFGVDTDQLAELLTDGGYDFFHYIGHATEDGLRCPDGELDVRTLPSVDVGVFFLNACRSYEQGLALTRRGAFGGVSTYADVNNDHAVDAGETMARLLNRGFSLRGALEIARANSLLGDQYLIVGDGSADIAQSDGGAPAVIELERSADGFDFAIRSYSTKEFKLGTATESTLHTVSDRHLSPGVTPFSNVTRDSLHEYITWTELPLIVDDELQWNDGIGPALID
ncbi:hypothetical protein [Natrinema salaciae]|uniref:CHAT domain-containing protein n=1 Tax=Natrinema salaciae TaxID=1186196 RepID=A0A1H9SDR6_9EURY|nr:hypothetical protein [Natrinema salaciae]SER82725.1 hypothetical protein SAMN04489841_4677 [Natrinema salaciae]